MSTRHRKAHRIFGETQRIGPIRALHASVSHVLLGFDLNPLHRGALKVIFNQRQLADQGIVIGNADGPALETLTELPPDFIAESHKASRSVANVS